MQVARRCSLVRGRLACRPAGRSGASWLCARGLGTFRQPTHECLLHRLHQQSWRAATATQHTASARISAMTQPRQPIRTRIPGDVGEILRGGILSTHSSAAAGSAAATQQRAEHPGHRRPNLRAVLWLSHTRGPLTRRATTVAFRGVKHKAKKGWLATCRDAMQSRIPTITRSAKPVGYGYSRDNLRYRCTWAGMMNQISPIAPNSGTSTLGTPLPCAASSVVRQEKAGARAGAQAGLQWGHTGRNWGPLADGAWSQRRT